MWEIPRNAFIFERNKKEQKLIYFYICLSWGDSSLTSVAVSWFLTIFQQKAALLVKVWHKALSLKINYLTFFGFLAIVLSFFFIFQLLPLHTTFAVFHNFLKWSQALAILLVFAPSLTGSLQDIVQFPSLKLILLGAVLSEVCWSAYLLVLILKQQPLQTQSHQLYSILKHVLSKWHCFASEA